MSEEQSAHHTKNEIIIVKRRHDDEHDGSHGAWKIAYADFMTAMMAFFLVMWLINAANDQTKASVASYFNPIKLVDQKPTSKGIKDSGHSTKQGELAQKTNKKGTSVSTGDGGQTGRQEKAFAGDKNRYSEADYFKNPYSVLSEIARQTGEKTNISAAGAGGAQKAGAATGASGGKTYRDPFDPDFWSQQVQTVRGVEVAQKDVAMPVPGSTASGKDAKEQARAKVMTKPADDDKPALEKSTAAAARIHVTRTHETRSHEAGAKDGGAADVSKKPSDRTVKTALAEPVENTKAANAAKPHQPAKTFEAAAGELRKKIAEATGGAVGKLAEGISVKPAKGGVLVSITDRVDDGMFGVGSAVPSHDMVVAMQKIGEVLSKRKGQVLIRGYTDARPYKGKDYDNWRLSTARAESAYYMLVRGGLDESRVKQISGFADRHLLLPDKPFAAANRRIEILVGTKEKTQ